MEKLLQTNKPFPVLLFYRIEKVQDHHQLFLFAHLPATDKYVGGADSLLSEHHHLNADL